jgi:hypothetical protein
MSNLHNRLNRLERAAPPPVESLTLDMPTRLPPAEQMRRYHADRDAADAAYAARQERTAHLRDLPQAQLMELYREAVDDERRLDVLFVMPLAKQLEMYRQRFVGK